jgi:hypothetical protein
MCVLQDEPSRSFGYLWFDLLYFFKELLFSSLNELLEWLGRV